MFNIIIVFVPFCDVSRSKNPYLTDNSPYWYECDIYISLNGLQCIKFSIICTGRCFHGLLTRYVKLRVAHAPGMPGTFSPPPTSKKTAIWRFGHASRHVRQARAVMHVGIANPRWRGKLSWYSRHAQPVILRIWQEAHYSRWIDQRTLWYEQ